jgi:nucleotide-binding universal stress UspA family protein
MQILVATDLSTRSHRALRRAGLLAQTNGAELTLLHVVDDDQPANLVDIEIREVRRILGEQIIAVPELRGVCCRPVVFAGDPSAGILHAAAAARADLIVMGAHRKCVLRDIFVGTTIERVVRAAACPVLRVNHEAERSHATAVAAVDASELCAHAIRTAQRLQLVEDCRVAIAHAFSPPGQVMMFYAGLTSESINEYVTSARLRARSELDSFLKSNGFDDPTWLQHVEEGVPFEVISRVVEAKKPDLLIIGTHGRSGITKALLGSVTEEALRSLDLDVLVVPPAREMRQAGTPFEIIERVV